MAELHFVFVSGQPVQRSADKQQGLSLFRSHMIEESAARPSCCKFVPDLCVMCSVVTLFNDGEEMRGFG
jgi:hypothetical protein